MCAEFASKLGTAINGRVSKKAAAAVLGVSRQMLDVYLKEGATPGSDIVLRAMKAWGFAVSYRGREITSSQMARPSPIELQATAEQLLLPLKEAIQSLADEDIRVTIAKKDANRIQLGVSIRFAS